MIKGILLFIGLVAATIACQHGQYEQSISPQLASAPSEPIDSLITLKITTNNTDVNSTGSTTITMKLPRFEAIVRQNQTPIGQLDKAMGTLVDAKAGTQYLYNQQGQPAGYASFPQDKIKGGLSLYYEYADNHIYRVYTKVYEAEIVGDFIYFLDELHYENGHPTTVSSYFLDLKKGTATFNSIADFEYDPQGHIITTRNRKRDEVYPVYTWQGDNIISRQDYYPNGTPMGFGYSYTYDGKINPLKTFELPHRPISTNNELSETIRYTDINLVSQTSYELSYNPSGFLSSSVTVPPGYPSVRQPPVYYLYK